MIRLIRFLALSLIGAAAATNVFAQAAYVHDMSGSATAQTAGGQQRTLRVGDLVNTGDTVSTGLKSSAVVKFEDGQIMSLNEGTSFALQQYNFNKQNVAQSSFGMRFLRGSLRYISGVIGSTNPQAIRLAAGSATIGIRGSIVDITDPTPTTGPTASVVASTNPIVSVLQGTASVVVPGAPPATVQTNNFVQVTPTAVTQPQLNTNLPPTASLAAQQHSQRPVPQNNPAPLTTASNTVRQAAAAKDARAQAQANPQNTTLQQTATQLEQQAQTAVNQLNTESQTLLTTLTTTAGATAPTPLPTGIVTVQTNPLTTTTTTTTATSTESQTTTPSSTTTTTPTGGAGAGGGGASASGTP